MKYVMMEVKMKEITMSVPFLFPDLIVHADMELAIRAILYRSFPTAQSIKAVSAGFAEMDVLTTSGGSETMKLKACKEDANLINSVRYGGNFK